MFVAVDPDRHDAPQETNTFLLRMLVLKVKGGHVALGATIENRDIRRAQPPCRIGRIDRRIAGADDRDTFGDGRRIGGFVTGDELQRIDHTAVIVSGDAEAMRRAQANAEKEAIEFLLQLLEVLLGADFRFVPELDAEAANQLDLRRLARAGSLYSATP